MGRGGGKVKSHRRSKMGETETLNQVVRLVEAFRAFDGDNDGRITREELGGMMGSIGYRVSEEEVGRMMEEGDKNRDGLLSMQEFLELSTKDLECVELGHLLRAAFQALDEEGSETVTGEELHEAMADSLSLENCEHIVASLDVDGDGAVSLDDFRLILNALL
ncbi:probable calcium-binding protein CML25 [Prosopis cineraria]|uniref:probable calcium-binding protein CML25 n=1 Tax=Prosopis cineraria TaxID=364024 RepID=UPI0024106FDE|nr:probable calcium-binding protein CML25 [Prosopis cineraria]